MTHYVLGFLFSENPRRGKIEAGESPEQAMVREFKEETGVQTNVTDWRHYCTMGAADFECSVFTAINSACLLEAKTVTEEQVVVASPAAICSGRALVISNLPWLVTMALDDNCGKPFHTTVRYAHPFKPMLSAQILEAL
jgi:8-oxo-dGTP diphosphatase